MRSEECTSSSRGTGASSTALIWTAAHSLLGLLLAGHALAEAPLHYCNSAAEIERKVEFCFENQLYVSAANQCLVKLEEEIKTETAALGNQFHTHNDASVSAQGSKLTNSESDLNDSGSSLALLLGHATLARKEVGEYLSTIILPGSPSKATLARFNLFPWLSMAECYSKNRSALLAKAAELDQRIASLKKTLAASSLMLKKDKGNLKKLSLGGAPQARSTKANGAGAKKALEPQHNSTITGDTQINGLERVPAAQK